MRTHEDFQIDAESGQLINGNIEILLERNFRNLARGQNMRVLTFGHANSAGRPWAAVAQPVAGSDPRHTRNAVLVHPLPGRRIADALQRAITSRAGEDGYPVGVDVGTLEFVIPVQVSANHWVLAHLTPGVAGYSLAVVDSLADPEAEKAERVRLARANGYSAADIRRIEAEDAVSQHFVIIRDSLNAAGINIIASIDLSCGQQLAGDEGTPEVPYWSCGFITAQNAEMLVARGGIRPALEYTPAEKARLFHQAQEVLTAEGRLRGALPPIHVDAIPVIPTMRQHQPPMHHATTPARHSAPLAPAHTRHTPAHIPAAAHQAAPQKGKKSGSVTLQNADLLSQPVDAIINAANVDMLLGAGASGLSGHIHTDLGANALANAMSRAAGRQFIPVGAAVTTSVSNIPGRNRGSKIETAGIKHVIHAVGPDCGDPAQNANRAALLEAAYENAFQEAMKKGARTIGVPTISTGIFAFPKAEAAEIMAKAIKRHQGHFDEINVCTRDPEMLELLSKELGIAVASPAVKKAASSASAPAATVADKAKLEAELKKAQEELEKQQALILEEEEKLAKLLVNAPFKALDGALTCLQDGIKGINFSNGTNALLSICGLIKSVVSIIPTIALQVKDTLDKAEASDTKTQKAEEKSSELEDKIAELIKAIIKSSKAIAAKPTDEKVLESEKKALAKASEVSKASPEGSRGKAADVVERRRVVDGRHHTHLGRSQA